MKRPWWMTRYNCVEMAKVVAIITAVIILGVLASELLAP